MKTKTLVILLVIFGLLAGAGALVIRLKSPSGPVSAMGKLILENLPANEISAITIKGTELSVLLAKKPDRWVVENRYHYPADFSKIADFVRKLKQAKIGRQFQSSEATLKRLSLESPDDKDAGEEEKGTKIELKDESGKLLASLLLGKPRESGTERSIPDGHYVTLDNDPTIYLIDTHFAHLQKEPSEWLDKALLKVEANEVKKISSLSADGKTINYTFGRAEKGTDLEPSSLPANKKVDTSALNRLASSLSSLSMEDVVGPWDDSVSTELKQSDKLEYHLFNGIIYRLYPGKACSEDGQCYLKVEVDYQGPAAEKKPAADDKASSDEKTSSEKTPEEIDLEAKQLNKRLSPWVYVISKWQHDSFVTDLDKLLEKPDKTRTKKNG
ncbi:MAG: DUF4340 domain-containing protein [Desulfobacteraceae bacterium]|nr:MAG: DUF4340 domain-containing protein [Desulfobacteraceae bacterium]